MTVGGVDPGRWWVGRRGPGPYGWRLLVVPHAGAGTGAFAPWHDLVPTDCELLVARLPGRESRFGEPLLRRADDAADRLAAALVPLAPRPTVLFGWSMGALLAFLVAQRLHRSGSAAPDLLVVGGAESPTVGRRRPPLHALPDAAFRDAVRDLGGTAPEVFAHPGLFELVGPALRADLEVVETWTPRAGPPLGVPVAVYTGTDDTDLDPGAVAAWSEVTTHPVRYRQFDGGHFVHLDRAAEVVAAVVADVGRAFTVPNSAIPPGR